MAEKRDGNKGENEKRRKERAACGVSHCLAKGRIWREAG